MEKLLFGKAPEAEVDDYIPANFWSKDAPPVSSGASLNWDLRLITSRQTWILHGDVDNRVGIEQSLSVSNLHAA